MLKLITVLYNFRKATIFFSYSYFTNHIDIIHFINNIEILNQDQVITKWCSTMLMLFMERFLRPPTHKNSCSESFMSNVGTMHVLTSSKMFTHSHIKIDKWNSFLFIYFFHRITLPRHCLRPQHEIQFSIYILTCHFWRSQCYI